MMHGALYQAVRRCLSQQEDDLMWDAIRVILRRHGALPLPRITALLSDEALEVMQNVKGGLRRYMQERPVHFHVEVLPSGVTVAMLTTELRRARFGDSSRLLTQVLAHVAASPQQQLTVSQVFRALPALEQRKCGNEKRLESLLLQEASLLTVHNGVVKAAPTSFMARRGISHAPPPPLPNRTAKVCESVPEAPHTSSTFAEDAKLNKLLALLYRKVPFSYYVPLRLVVESSQSFMCFAHGISVDEILEELHRVPATTLDCRVIGGELDDVFLRMMDAERRPYTGDESKLARHYEVLPLGAPLLDAFRGYAAASPENRQRLQSGISMGDLKNVLPSDLLQRLFIYSTADKESACIFIFDRLRHLFDVNMTAYKVRLWEVLAAHAQPSSLTWQTTPLPLVLRHFLMALSEKPLSPEAVLAAIPMWSKKQLQCAYDTVEAFVAHHSLYLLLKDGLVWTPYLAAASQGARVPTTSRSGAVGRNLTDAVKARMLMEVMPLHHPLDWNRFRLHPLVRELPFETRNMRPEFFERHRECFRVYEVLGSTSFIVGRRDGIPPAPELLQPPCNSLSDLVRQMALFSIGGAQESTVLNNLSKEARMMMRRYGSLENIAMQLPMWFDVRNERQEPGCAIISYIATEGACQPRDRDQCGED
ncbi:hypothetical protein DQ04_05031000 [Trypanosoma grayi]|uniref:hypothetical protein n=1 Tax=Trypanosoma grayi TaxID=71804 RepID=UPI0004F49209|nr:hypothetical protein DQ04_05031000 [Trypanosoma grayi]KEG09553.1 hypothetical protein DQ04_05031000 [Trypanosoma grayi]